MVNASSQNYSDHQQRINRSFNNLNAVFILNAHIYIFDTAQT